MSKNQTKYVDGFVLVVPQKRKEEYVKMAQDAAKIWVKHGALNYRECILEHVQPDCITFTFPIMAKAKSTDTVWFSYIEYKSKAHRDKVNKKVMEEFEAQGKGGNDWAKNMPFDMKRMAYGGFAVEVSS